MKKKQTSKDQLPLFIPRSNTSTQINKTGSWRYFRPLYEEKTAPCSAACPAGEDIPRIEMLVSQGLFKKAWETILDENPFPSICGRVCFHPCEKACNRNELDEPIAIHSLERFIGESVISSSEPADLKKVSDNGKKVAVAGAGPAGLATAYFLSRLGYQCDVFEAQSEPGGILRWGIPAYRLPENILKKEIKRIEKLGIHFHCETPVTEALLEKINQNYNAFFIGCGYGRPIKLKIPGEELPKVHHVLVDPDVFTMKKIAVVGGGDASLEAALALAPHNHVTLIVRAPPARRFRPTSRAGVPDRQHGRRRR